MSAWACPYCEGFEAFLPWRAGRSFPIAPSGDPLGHSWIWGIKALLSTFILVCIFLRNNRHVMLALVSALCMSGMEVHGVNSALLKQDRHKGGSG